MKRLKFAVMMGAALVASAAEAGKVNIPKEGGYEFDFCSIGSFKAMSNGEKVFVSHYEVVANLRTDPGGRAFDRMASLCYGTYSRLNGRHQENGVCELTDQDGDKWWMDYRGNSEGSGGSYTAAHGTGKYEGMNLKGQYVLDFWPSALKDGVQACNKNSGTYRLK